MTLPFQIQIPKRSAFCIVGGEALSSGMDYFSALVENEQSEYERHDFCLNCWNKETQGADKKQLARYWKSKVPLKKTAAVLPQDKDERVLALLKAALIEETVEAQEDSFVLALYLARRRNLALRKEIVQKDQTVLQVYELLETEEMIGVKKLILAESQIEAIQLRIAKQLNN